MEVSALDTNFVMFMFEDKACVNSSNTIIFAPIKKRVCRYKIECINIVEDIYMTTIISSDCGIHYPVDVSWEYITIMSLCLWLL